VGDGGAPGPVISTAAAITASLELDEVGPHRYRAGNVELGHAVVFGGQLMAQSIVAALAGHDGKTAKTLHTVFARSGRPEEPVDIDVDRMHDGRTFASSAVTISQGGRLCTRSLVLLSADEPDLIRHADPAPDLSPPGEGEAGHGMPGWLVDVVGGVDIADPDAVGPPELDVWTRFVGVPTDVVTGQALLAFASDGFLLGTAMRPHRGVGQSQAHRTLTTGVISHTLTFHEPFDVNGWLLLRHRSPSAGRGRTYGRADVFAADGRLVASFVQDGMIRPRAQDGAGSPL
jgi:acyl-CoA thioesterase II